MSFYLSLRPLSISLISAVKSIPFNAGGEMGGKGIVKRRGWLGESVIRRWWSKVSLIDLKKKSDEGRRHFRAYVTETFLCKRGKKKPPTPLSRSPVQTPSCRGVEVNCFAWELRDMWRFSRLGCWKRWHTHESVAVRVNDLLAAICHRVRAQITWSRVTSTVHVTVSLYVPVSCMYILWENMF